MAEIGEMLKAIDAEKAARESAAAQEDPYGDIEPNIPRPGGRATDFQRPNIAQRAVRAIGNEADELGAMAGGIKGFEMGVRAGGSNPLVRFGMGVLGGAIGAGTGFSAGTGVKEGLHQLSPEDFEPGARGSEMYNGVVRAMIEDAAGSGAGEAVSTILRGGKLVVQSMLGVKEAGRKYAEKAAKEFGVTFSPADLSEARGIGFLHKGVGRLPFVGSGFRHAYEVKADQVLTAKNRLIRAIGPTENLAALGYKVNELAQKRFDFVAEAIGKNYEEAEAYAKKVGATVPGESLQKTATRALARLNEAMGLEYVSKTKNGKYKNEVVRFLYEELGKNNQGIPVARYDGMLGSLQELIDSSGNPKIKGILAAAAVESKAVLNEVSDEHTKFLFQQADAYMASMLKPFETAAAKRFERVTKGRFKRGQLERPGTKEFDEIIDRSMAKSPEAVRNVKHLIQDPDTFDSVVATKLDDLFTEALARGERSVGGSKALRPEVGYGGIDINHIRKQMGLTNKNSLEYQTWKEFLKETSAPIQKVERLLDTAETALKHAPPDVNQFIARRTGIGGMRSVLNLIGLGAAGGGAAVGGAGGSTLAAGVTATLVLRNMVNVAANPRLMRAATVAMDSKTKLPVRRAAMVALIKALEPFDDSSLAQNTAAQAQ